MNSKETFERILAVYPNSKGYAFAVMEGPTEIIEKSMVSVSPVDNSKILRAVKQLITEYSPNTLVIENAQCKYSRKSPRAKQLLKSLTLSARRANLNLNAYTREEVRLVFEIWRAKTKYEIAEVIAKNIKSFQMLLYPKPKYPTPQLYLTAIFDAVSLGITHYYRTT